MKRSLAKAVVIQGGGAAIGVATVVAVSRFLGPQQQGLFATYKNWFDIVSTVLLLGIPQGMIYAINKHYVSCGLAARLSLLMSVAAIPFIIAIDAVEVRFGYLPNASPVWLYGIIPLGIAGYVYHGLARSVLLTREDGAVFSLLSSLPTIGIAGILAAQFLLGGPRMDAVFSCNGVLCGTVAAVALRRHDLGGAASNSGWYRVLLRQSAHFFIQSVLFALQPLIVFFLLRRDGSGLGPVGLFSFSLVALVSANSLIGMLAPILYNHWSKSESHDIKLLVRTTLLRTSFALGTALTLFLYLLAPLTPWLVGNQFSGAEKLIRILSLAAIPLFFTRLAQPALMATNRTDIATRTGLLRILSVVVLMSWFGGLTGAAISWIVGEFVAALTLFYLVGTSSMLQEQPPIVNDTL